MHVKINAFGKEKLICIFIITFLSKITTAVINEIASKKCDSRAVIFFL